MCRFVLVMVSLVGCQTRLIEMGGRPCENEADCLADFTCDPSAGRCVTEGDPCASEGVFLPCEPGDTSCTAGCRLCSDGTWSACEPPVPPTNPILKNIVDICAGDEARVTWTTANGLTYDVELWNGSAWVSPDEQHSGSATQLSLPAGYGYKWRIRTHNAFLSTDWRESALFDVVGIPANPALGGVVDLCIGQDASVDWTTEVDHSYEIEFFNGTAFVAPSSSAAGSATALAPPLGQTFKWRIRTTHRGCVAEWSESATFQVEPLPTLSKIHTTTLSGVIEADWQLSDGCDPEQVEVRRQEDTPPTSINDGTSITGTAEGFSDVSASNNQVYYYRVYLQFPAHSPIEAALICAMLDKVSINIEQVVPGTIVVDGDPEDWEAAGLLTYSFSFSQRYDESRSGMELLDPDIQGSARLAYDPDNLYFFFRVTDKFVHVDPDDEIRANDAVALYFDMGFTRENGAPHEDDFSLVYTADSNRWWSGRGNGLDEWDASWEPGGERIQLYEGNLNQDSKANDESWTVEVRIPASDLGVSQLEPGATVGFTLSLFEDDTWRHAEEHLYRLSGGSIDMIPSTWGMLQF